MRSYPCEFMRQSNRMVILTLPDVPEAVVVGYSGEDALRRAPAVLDSILRGYASEGRSPPSPSRAPSSQRVRALRLPALA